MISELVIDKVLAEKYLEGYESGSTWPNRWEDHTPGGPWVNTSRDKYERSLLENKTWVKGWKEGHSNKTKEKFDTI